MRPRGAAHGEELTLEDLPRPAVDGIGRLRRQRLGTHALAPSPQQDVGTLLFLSDAKLHGHGYGALRVLTAEHDELVRLADGATQGCLRLRRGKAARVRRDVE